MKVGGSMQEVVAVNAIPLSLHNLVPRDRTQVWHGADHGRARQAPQQSLGTMAGIAGCMLKKCQKITTLKT